MCIMKLNKGTINKTVRTRQNSTFDYSPNTDATVLYPGSVKSEFGPLRISNGDLIELSRSIQKKSVGRSVSCNTALFPRND